MKNCTESMPRISARNESNPRTLRPLKRFPFCIFVSSIGVNVTLPTFPPHPSQLLSFCDSSPRQLRAGGNHQGLRGAISRRLNPTLSRDGAFSRSVKSCLGRLRGGGTTVPL